VATPPLDYNLPRTVYLPSPSAASVSFCCTAYARQRTWAKLLRLERRPFPDLRSMRKNTCACRSPVPTIQFGSGSTACRIWSKAAGLYSRTCKLSCSWPSGGSREAVEHIQARELEDRHGWSRVDTELPDFGPQEGRGPVQAGSASHSAHRIRRSSSPTLTKTKAASSLPVFDPANMAGTPYAFLTVALLAIAIS